MSIIENKTRDLDKSLWNDYIFLDKFDAWNIFFLCLLQFNIYFSNVHFLNYIEWIHDEFFDSDTLWK